MAVHQYGVLELALQSARDYPNPARDCQAVAEFTGPSGRTVPIRAFWDGGRLWRVRFSPDEVGAWTWRTRCSAPDDAGLLKEGERFECVAYTGENPLYRHGPLQRSGDRRSLHHRDGTPFFWLGDTAWNGVIRGGDDNWRRFLETRSRQRFSVVQFVCCHWRGDAVDETGESACSEEHPIRINSAFFQRLDRRVAMVNASGLVAAPVALWSLLKTDLGRKLAEEDALELASYIVSRYDAYQVVWLLGGDGNYQEIGVDRWKRLGRAVFKLGHDRLVALHPCGQNWVGEAFRGEDWYDLIGYQSGHGDSEEHLKWLVQGPPARDWDHAPPLPVINLEPNYESAIGYQHKSVFGDYEVRRAAYWSLLVSPTAGLTYGHDAIWNWNFETGPSEGHGDWHGRRVPPWHTGLETPGIRSMTVLRGIFERLAWTTLRPAQAVLAEQAGERDVRAFVAAARAANGTLVVYAPCGGTVRFASQARVDGPVRLVDPRTGESRVLSDAAGEAVQTPDTRDWLIICGAGWTESEE